MSHPPLIAVILYNLLTLCRDSIFFPLMNVAAFCVYSGSSENSVDVYAWHFLFLSLVLIVKKTTNVDSKDRNTSRACRLRLPRHLLLISSILLFLFQ